VKFITVSCNHWQCSMHWNKTKMFLDWEIPCMFARCLDTLYKLWRYRRVTSRGQHTYISYIRTSCSRRSAVGHHTAHALSMTNSTAAKRYWLYHVLTMFRMKWNNVFVTSQTPCATFDALFHATCLLCIRQGFCITYKPFKNASYNM
jgi:hypothetical protein